MADGYNILCSCLVTENERHMNAEVTAKDKLIYFLILFYNDFSFFFSRLALSITKETVSYLPNHG